MSGHAGRGTMPPVKPDPDAASPYIKPDPDNKDAVHADVGDDDLYEDAGDLDFSNAAQSVWLSRIPRSLWQNWENLDDDEEIQVGTVRIEGPPNDIKRVCCSFVLFKGRPLRSSRTHLTGPKLQVSLRLNEREDNREIPKDYILQRQTINNENISHSTQNTYVFTEKDVPGGDNRMVVFGEARSALYESMKRDARKKERKKKWEPYVRRTVPSMHPCCVFGKFEKALLIHDRIDLAGWKRRRGVQLPSRGE